MTTIETTHSTQIAVDGTTQAVERTQAYQIEEIRNLLRALAHKQQPKEMQHNKDNNRRARVCVHDAAWSVAERKRQTAFT